MTMPVTTPTNNPSKAQLQQALLEQLGVIFPKVFGLKVKKPLNRIDLDGQKVAEITDSERTYAKAQLQKSQ